MNTIIVSDESYAQSYPSLTIFIIVGKRSKECECDEINIYIRIRTHIKKTLKRAVNLLFQGLSFYFT